MRLKELIKDNYVEFDSFRQGILYYRITYTNIAYIFPVPTSDVGTATMLSRDKAILFMRWIRKAIEDKTLVKA